MSRAELVGGADEKVGAATADARTRLATTMTELRGLAHGLHPALLSQAGLGAALTSLVDLSDRVTVTVAPELATRRLAPLIEATAWYVASEAVVNALKHGDGAVSLHADVRATPSSARSAMSAAEARPSSRAVGWLGSETGFEQPVAAWRSPATEG